MSKYLESQRRAIRAVVLEKLCALSTDERRSLCEVAKPLARAIPRAHQDALVAAGLGWHALGGFMLTDLGNVAAGIVRDTPSLI